MRSKLTVPASTSDEDLKALALADDKVQAILNGAAPKNVVVVPKRLVNVVA